MADTKWLDRKIDLCELGERQGAGRNLAVAVLVELWLGGWQPGSVWSSVYRAAEFEFGDACIKQLHAPCVSA